MGVKNDFLTALRNLPAGLLEFLDVAIPAPPEGLSLPTTEEEAIIMQGILSFYILQFFTAFAGLKPVPLALRIGQHSNVAEALLLSGLEYFGVSQQEFEVLEPIAGNKYAPGDLRIVVSAKSSKITSIDVSLTHGESYDTTSLRQDETGSRWFGYARMGFDEDIKDAQFDFSVVFDDKDGTTKTTSVAITIEEDGESDVDLVELDNARRRALAAADGILYALNPLELIFAGEESVSKKIAVALATNLLEPAVVALIKAIQDI